MKSINPSLANEWNYQKNGSLTPEQVTIKSSKKVWWRCVNGHEWQASVANRTKGSGCPYCASKKATPGSNDLATLYPALVEQWDYEKNKSITPDTVRPGSGKKVWWKCENGHEWQASVTNRIRGTGCPFCKKRRKNHNVQ